MPLNEVMYYDNVQEIKKVCIQLVLSISYWSVRVAVVNGLSKTMGLGKFSLNFTGLRGSLFQQLCASHILDFFHRAVSQS